MAYLLTVSRTDFSRRRQRWTDPSHRSKIRTVGSPELPLGYPGALVLVDDRGEIRYGVPMDGPKGMLEVADGLLVACYTEVRLLSTDLSRSHRLVSGPWCNDLHSLRPSPNGFVVAVAGVDAAHELADDGSVRWSWWAAEHGFTTDQRSEPYTLVKDRDHRRFSYPVDLQSTHINAIAALDDATFLATVFHDGTLVSIDRATGDCAVVVSGLQRPHAIRVLDDGTVTFSNTGAGEAVRGRVRDGNLEVLQQIDAKTTWLHDAYFTGDGWMLVDGANSRVVHTDAEGTVLRIDTFDPDWCLYEVLPWAGPDPYGPAAAVGR